MRIFAITIPLHGCFLSNVFPVKFKDCVVGQGNANNNCGLKLGSISLQWSFALLCDYM